MSSSFQFQIANFISAMAASIKPEARTQQEDDTLQDFAPIQSAALCNRIELKQEHQILPEVDYLTPWLPPPTKLISSLDLETLTRRKCASEMDHKSIRDFGKFVAQLESPSASAFEHCDLHKTRLALCERSLTYADFRHAVDHQIDHASSIWQNN